MDLPEFFSLDIGNHSVKVAKVWRSGDKAKLENIAAVRTEFGILDNASDQGMKALAERVKAARQAAGINTVNCVAGIPEAPVFSRLLTIPAVDPEKIQESVHWELKPLIPVPIDDVDIAFLEVGEKDLNGQKQIDVFAVAAPKSLTERFKKLTELAGVNLLALETEALSNARTVTFNYATGQADTMIFDFGAHSTDITLTRGGVPVFTQNISTGSDALTKTIAADYGIDIEQAEKYKRSFGLDPNLGDGKISNSLDPIMQIMVGEMKRTLTYFREKLGDTGTTKLYMCGEAANLPGLGGYLTKNLGLESTLVNPVAKIEVAGSAQGKVDPAAMAGFSVAIGLGLKDR